MQILYEKHFNFHFYEIKFDDAATTMCILLQPINHHNEIFTQRETERDEEKHHQQTIEKHNQRNI